MVGRLPATADLGVGAGERVELPGAPDPAQTRALSEVGRQVEACLDPHADPCRIDHPGSGAIDSGRGRRPLHAATVGPGAQPVAQRLVHATRRGRRRARVRGGENTVVAAEDQPGVRRVVVDILVRYQFVPEAPRVDSGTGVLVDLYLHVPAVDALMGVV